MTRATHLTSSQLARLGERLRAERARLLGLTSRPAAPGDAPGLAEPGDDADRAEVQTERSTELRVGETERSRLAQVERALAKLADGTYGKSDVSGEEIPLERLEALPWATTTVDDADR